VSPLSAGHDLYTAQRSRRDVTWHD